MSIAREPKTLRVALIGNPNTGKSTLFSALAGVHQHVGNYPGVTVEKKTGWMDHAGRRYELIDLPGLYSVAPRSRDEAVAVDVLLGRLDDAPPVDAVVCIVDAGNLQRGFYLLSQVLELGLPTLVAVNMLDVARRHGVALDLDRLRRQLPVPVVAIQANRRIGLAELKTALAETATGGPLSEGATAGSSSSVLESTDPYAWTCRVLEGVVTEPARYQPTASDRVDRVLTHRVGGTLVFALLMVAVFQAVFVLGRLGEGAIGAATAAVSQWVEAGMAEGALRSLAVDGIIGGVGGVLRFLPQILVLFLLIAVLEDCGYMARAAYLMDRLMTRVGLSGRSFIPMLSCFACAVPGVMATRVIDNERDRLTTILVAPLMPCSARLPVYALLIGAFIPPHSWLGGLLGLQGLTLVGLYVLGIVTAVAAAMVLRRTILRGGRLLLLMELPSYKWPSPRMVLVRVAQRGWLFVRCAGTLVLVVSVVVWAALYYPHNVEQVEGPLRPTRLALQTELAELRPGDARRAEVAQELDRLDRRIAAAYQRQSVLGRVGRVVEPVVRPLGWDWRIGCAVIASLPAREIVVATMAVIFDVDDSEDLHSEEGRTRFQAGLDEATWDGSDPPRRLFTLPVALSIMVFFALCIQCAATLAVIRQETGGWRWPAFTFTYMTTLAYLGALATFQFGTWIGL